jgi:acyl-CoA thioesterase FadM
MVDRDRNWEASSSVKHWEDMAWRVQDDAENVLLARAKWLRETTGGMFVVSETSVRYLSPARLDDELLVTARLQEAGRASLIIAQQALQKNGGALLCEGTIRIGWVESTSLQPGRIPSIILESLKQT